MLFRDLGVPRSTAASWIRRGPRPVVSAEVLALDQQELQAEILSLQRRVRLLLAIIRLAFLLIRLSGFCLDSLRVPDGNTKRSILAAVAHAQKALPLAVALRVLPFSIYVVQALLTGVVVVGSYLGHKYYSFRGGHPRDASDRPFYDPTAVSKD